MPFTLGDITAASATPNKYATLGNENPETPAHGAYAIAPSDTTDLPQAIKSIYVGVSGDVKVTTAIGDVVTFKAHPVGYMLVKATRVWATGTTATNLLGLYH